MDMDVLPRGILRSETLRLLVVEDDLADELLIATYLNDSFDGRVQIEHAETIAAASEIVRDQRDALHCVILDLDLPDCEGLASLQRLRKDLHGVPVVLLTATEDEALIETALSSGAHDYLPKRELSGGALHRAVRYAVQRVRLEDALSARGATDPLSGLGTPVLFEDRLAQAIARAQRTGESLAVVVIDLDDFGAVNDRWGHQVGDDVIRAVAGRITAAVRAEDSVARLDGDGFGVIAERVPDHTAATLIAERLTEAISERPVQIGSVELEIKASIGIRIFDGYTDPRQATRDADWAMYEAKSRGRDSVIFSGRASPGPEQPPLALDDLPADDSPFVVHAGED